MLIERIKKERLVARKEKNNIKASILTTLAGELESRAKRDGSEITDEIVISTARKFIQSNLDAISACPSSDGNSSRLMENEILESLMPKQLTEGKIVSNIVRTNITK
jgi:uncharacterized protein YqeY